MKFNLITIAGAAVFIRMIQIIVLSEHGKYDKFQLYVCLALILVLTFGVKEGDICE